jgi:CRISPR/Cas system CMR-associated protein Cmr5 small subunit
MNVKQRAMGEKLAEHSQRYKVHNNNYDSTPSLLKGRQAILHNKENNYNAHNYLSQEEMKFGYIESAKSTELPKRTKTSSNEPEMKQFKKHKDKPYAEELGCSQDFLKFRPKLMTEPQE